MVVTLGQQCHVGEKPTVTLYNYINRHAGTLDKTKTKGTISLDRSSICYTASRIVAEGGVQLNFIWCGVGKTNHNDEPYIPHEPFVFLSRQVGM